MSKAGFTEEQNAAVDARNTAVLVSAAAGSGKTSVLTQRLLQRICEGENVDRFLVITFTRAAAAELRGRILKGLSEIAAQQPDNAHIRRQTALLYRAQIGTIDSFCANIVRENAHLAGVSPAFAVADQDRADAMKTRAADEVIERAYDRVHSDAGLRLLVDSLGAGRDDSRLHGYVLDIYDQLQSRAWPMQWVEQALKQLDVSEVSDVGQTPWGEYLLQRACAKARSCELALERACGDVEACGEEKLVSRYVPDLEAMADAFRAIQTGCGIGWDAAAGAIGGYTVPRAPTVTRPENQAVKDAAKAVRDRCAEALKKLKKQFISCSDEHLRDIRTIAPALRALAELVAQLDEEYARRKRRADLLDFSDAEHFCLQMLCDPDDPDRPSELAHSLSARFCEVMVDEYQDVNAVQNSIFRRVSDEGRRLFMVGDVKQSIYRFRLAEPRIFMDTYKKYASGENGRRILLRANFRSRAAVLAACNSVFEKIMSQELGDVDYNDEARLAARASYPAEGEVLPELVLVTPVQLPDGTFENKRLSEARWVAARIRQMLDDGEQVYDAETGAMRPVRRGDIAVLMRAPGSSGAVFHKALAEKGIISSMDRGESFLMMPEVSFALQMMAVTDNPRQDIPLVAALRGAPFAFTPDELARIRAEAGRADLWDALLSRAQTDERCASFVSLVRELRDAAADEPMQALLQRLYNRTGLMACCAALPDGDERAAGLMRLYDYACRFEKTETRGLNRFTAWLAMLEKNGIKQEAGGSADSVRIMSIHKSKGLEFPVVFLADNSHEFRNDKDPVLCDSRLGLGMKLTDAGRGLSWPTVVFTAIKQKKHLEDLSEQQRVLYVAMTRAKERLIMTCAAPKENKWDEMCTVHAGQDGPIDPELLSGVQSPAEWLIAAALRDGGRTIALRSEQAPAQPERQAVQARPEAAAGADCTELAQRLAWQYPYADAVPLPSKLTATELKEPEVIAPEDADIEAAPLVPETRERIFRLPDLAGQERPLTGPERGTAAHLVMQFIDYAKTGSGEEIRREIQRMRAGGLLDDRQAEAVSVQDIRAFFASPIGQRLVTAAQLHREFRFSLLCPASLWYPQARDGEEILLQGVIDCWFADDGGITLLDFKTDGAVVPEHYAAQIGAYAYALRRMTGLPVKKAVLWYLRRRKAVEMPLPEAEA